LVATSLVGANLRGHDSHGVMRIPQYLKAVETGEAVPGAMWSVITEADSLLLSDGHWGFGQTQAQRLTRRLIDKAHSAGTVAGTLIRSSHVGRLGEYCEMAAAAGLVSMAMANTHGFARRVAPPGGKAPRLGTNPIAIGVPSQPAPLIMDFGTSATAEGKVRVKKIAGQKCPDGWLLDNQGRPTNDPNVLYNEPQGTILPMGGSQAYKGFALALMVEIFAGALSGGVCNRERPTDQNGNCLLLQLWNPAAMGGAEHFAREVSAVVEFVRDCPRSEGIDEILLPGDPERKTLAERSARGIPLDDGNWAALIDLAGRLGVAAPAP
jgi:uncharacterized oxidoreductase